MRMKGIPNSLVVLTVFFVSVVPVVQAADLKIVDSGGLVRLTRIVRESARVTVSVADGKGSGECVATNVDGIAAERREKISAKGECIFENIPAGTWQIAVFPAARWRAAVRE